ncbi:hypothetical protein [Roseisolibacter agri]|uniref:YtkA-like domain-containing protein n=1 Tax=Roseisolibacter agri TaxID=2014610 RepID=A0AA37QEW5_9BACT|nr:hypothetical protein [Roseisolibacter agri]GLC27591.1 hypothetical protein rosag_41040 [Roseisolibacter agri]
MIAGGIARRGAVGRAAQSLGMAGLLAAAAACGPAEPQPLRHWTPHYEFRMTIDPRPPHANEPTVYRVVVLDRETKQPIEGGEGQIFATSEDRVNRYDSFTPAPEVGTYIARITFVTAGDWKVGMRFRRDSTQAIERVEDWVQTVAAPRPLSERPFK